MPGPGPADRLLEAAARALEAGRTRLARQALEGAARLDASDPRLARLWARLPGDEGDTWAGTAADTPESWWAPDEPTPASGAGLSLLLAEADPPPVPAQAGRQGAALLARARACFERADFTGALECCDAVLEEVPGHPEAQTLRGKAEGTLVQMYESRLGALSDVPQVVMDPDDVVWLSLDHRAGFVLAQVDGTVSWEDLFALSGMDRLDTCRVLCQLLDEGVVAVEAGPAASQATGS